MAYGNKYTQNILFTKLSRLISPMENTKLSIYTEQRNSQKPLTDIISSRRLKNN